MVAGWIVTGGSPGKTGVFADRTWLRKTTLLKPNGAAAVRVEAVDTGKHQFKDAWPIDKSM